MDICLTTSWFRGPVLSIKTPLHDVRKSCIRSFPIFISACNNTHTYIQEKTCLQLRLRDLHVFVSYVFLPTVTFDVPLMHKPHDHGKR